MRGREINCKRYGQEEGIMEQGGLSWVGKGGQGRGGTEGRGNAYKSLWKPTVAASIFIHAYGV